MVADWILPKGDVEAWLERAKSGDRLLYGQGEQLVRGETSRFLREAYSSGEVNLVQPRSALPGRFDFTAIKREVVREKTIAGIRTSDPAMRVIYKRLVSAATRGERCPSDKMLADLAGLSSFAKAQWRIRKLERQGLIRTRIVKSVEDPNFRIATIAESGAETALPPELRS